MALHLVFSVLFLFISQCSSVIYHLNGSQYELMPPLFELDEYEDCLSEEGGIYCLLQLNLYAEPENQLIHMIREYSSYREKHYNHSNIDRGVCVRRSCLNFVDTKNSNWNKIEDLTDSLEACINDSIWKEYRLQAKVSKLLYCDHNNEPMDINALDWIVLVSLLILVAMNIIGSYYDYVLRYRSDKSEEIGNVFLLSFSVMQNWKWLTCTEVNDPKLRDLQSFHGIRSISSTLIVLAHTYLLIASGYTENTHDYEKTYDRPLYQFIYNGMMIVQVFFFMSGFLLVHHLKFEEQRRTFTAWDIPKVVLLRFSRLVPALLMTLAITLTWVRHLGSGPIWNLFVTGALVRDCQTYWWHTLLFVNNYMPENRFCLIPTWHIAADMQVFLVGLVAYILTPNRLRYWVLGILLILGTAAPAVQVYAQDLDAIVIMMPEFYRTLVNPTYRFLHIVGHNNLPCFIIGMITALFLHDLQKKGVDLSKSKWYGYAPYVTIGSIAAIFYSGSVFYYDVERASLPFRMVYCAAIRPVMGAVCAFGVTAIVMRTPSLVRSLLEWPTWVAPSRLSYCVFLLHMILVHFALGARSFLSSVSYFYVALMHLGIVFLSYIISLPFWLMIEAPFNRIFKHLRGKRA